MRQLLNADAIYPDSFENNTRDVLYETCGVFEYYLELLYKYYIPVMIFVGLIGNFLSCVVFLTTYLKMRSSSYYLAALAIADFAFLIVLTIVNCSFNGIFEIFNKEGWCQFLVYISSVASILSVWLIVAFTVERFVAVQYPLQRPSICTVSRSKATVCLLSTVAILSQCYVFWTAGVRKNDIDEDTCSMIPEQLPAMQVINTIDCVVTLIVPFILIVVMNVMIARNLFKFSRKMRNDIIDEYPSSEKSIDSKDSSKQIQTSTRRKQGPHSTSRKSIPTRISNKPASNPVEQLPCIQTKVPGLMSAKTQQSISKMLLLVSTVFIMLNLPSYAARLYIYFYNSIWGLNTPATIYCIQQFAMILFYTNYSINFSLYAMYGKTVSIQMSLQSLHSKRRWNRTFSGILADKNDARALSTM
ncbi:hypothetical protein Trydic_g20099 [Trypoxylus dichotomus]